MKLAIIGGRDFDDYELLKQTVRRHLSIRHEHHRDAHFNEKYVPVFDEVVSGGAKGADSLGARFAREQGIKLTEYLPDWEKYGKRAAFLRNEDIIKNSNFVLAFWDSVSKGTANSLSISKRLKKPTIIIYF